MIVVNSESVRPKSLTDRLATRVAREEEFARTGRSLRNKSLLFRYERYWIRPLLKAILKVTGLYGRGVRNALSPVVQLVPLNIPNLPSAFDGYRVLHLSDLHVDKFPALIDVLIPALDELHVDVCLVTGDYRFEDHGSCEEIYPLMRRLRPAIHANDGVFAILGNHDASPIAHELDAMGYTCLLTKRSRSGAAVKASG